jgi:AAA ATPase domain
MTGQLLEREAELGTPREALDRAGRGRGATVLVSGEAGIGKTSLVRAFAAGAGARVLAGVCDDLARPGPLARSATWPATPAAPWPPPWTRRPGASPPTTWTSASGSWPTAST